MKQQPPPPPGAPKTFKKFVTLRYYICTVSMFMLCVGGVRRDGPVQNCTEPVLQQQVTILCQF